MTAKHEDIFADSRITVSYWSTKGITPELRFAAWTKRPWPSLTTLFETTLIDEFATTSAHVLFGDMVVQLTHGSHRQFERSAVRAAKDGVTLLAASIMVSCYATGRADGRAIAAARGSIVVLDMARQSSLNLRRGMSVQIAIPRNMAEEQLGALGDLHGAVIPAEKAKLLIRHLQAARKSLPVLTVMDGPALARVIMELLGVALRSRTDTAPLADETFPSVALAIKQYLESALQNGPVPEQDVCAKFRLSRSTLQRLFQLDGGMQSYIRLRRLENVRMVLKHYGKQETVANLADIWGFSDASHLSRLFKRTYGVTITAYRTAER